MGAPELFTLALVVAIFLTPPILLVRWLTRRSQHARELATHCTDAGCPFAAYDHPAH